MRHDPEGVFAAPLTKTTRDPLQSDGREINPWTGCSSLGTWRSLGSRHYQPPSARRLCMVNARQVCPSSSCFCVWRSKSFAALSASSLATLDQNPSGSWGGRPAWRGCGDHALPMAGGARQLATSGGPSAPTGPASLARLSHGDYALAAAHGAGDVGARGRFASPFAVGAAHRRRRHLDGFLAPTHGTLPPCPTHHARSTRPLAEGAGKLLAFKDCYCRSSPFSGRPIGVPLHVSYLDPLVVYGQLLPLAPSVLWGRCLPLSTLGLEERARLRRFHHPHLPLHFGYVLTDHIAALSGAFA